MRQADTSLQQQKTRVRSGSQERARDVAGARYEHIYPANARGAARVHQTGNVRKHACKRRPLDWCRIVTLWDDIDQWRKIAA